MKKTIVAIFNNKAEAQDAKVQLLNNGFDSDDIDVSAGKTSGANANEEESGISRFFKNLFGANEESTERFSRVAEQGYVVTVYAHSDEDAQRASNLLDDYGAIDVDESYDKQFINKNYAGDRYDKNNSYNRVDSDDEIVTDQGSFQDRNDYANDLGENNKTIPVIEEDIRVGKKEIITGGVRLRSRIIEKPVEENLRLREEHIHVERTKVDRPATEEDLRHFKESTLEVTTSTEIPDIEKTSKVVEEVSLEKEVNHRDETIHDRVRKTEVDVEDIDPNDRLKSRNL